MSTRYPLVPRYGGTSSVLNITTTTVVKAKPGTLFTISVITPPTAAGGAYDATTTGGAVAANQIIDIQTGGQALPLRLDWPCANGIVINPGTGGVVSVAYA